MEKIEIQVKIGFEGYDLDSGSIMRGSHSGAFILERCITDGEEATKFFGLANLSIMDSTRY